MDTLRLNKNCLLAYGLSCKCNAANHIVITANSLGIYTVFITFNSRVDYILYIYVFSSIKRHANKIYVRHITFRLSFTSLVSLVQSCYL